MTLVHAPHYMDTPDEAFAAAGLRRGDVHGAFLICGYMSGTREAAQGKPRQTTLTQASA